MTLAVRSHLFPYRTQKLSSLAPKILNWRRFGKIGSCCIQRKGTVFRRTEYRSFFCVVVILRCKKRSVVLKRFKVGTSSLFVLYIKYYGRGDVPLCVKQDISPFFVKDTVERTGLTVNLLAKAMNCQTKCNTFLDIH